MRSIRLTLILATAIIAATSSVAFGVNFTGAFTENFNSMGASGTAAPTGWSVYTIGTSHDQFSYWTPTNGFVTALPASADIAGAIIASATLTGVTGPTTQKGTGGYNFGLAASSSDRALGTSPSGNAMSLLQLSLTNQTGGALTDLDISYDIRRFTTTTTNNAAYTGGPYSGVEEIPGYWLWYSLDNGATWVDASALNPTLSDPGGIVVPNTIGVTSVPSVDLALASNWASGSNLLLRWSDDNAQSPSPDQILGLDNVNVIAAPEPGSAMLLGLGAFGAVALRRTRRTA